jgi:hypothetical protein
MKGKAKNSKTLKLRRPAAKPRRSAREKAPTTTRQYFALSPEKQERWDAVAHIISRMRSGRLSLSKASAEFGVKPDLVKKLARSALRRQKSGKFVAKPTDRLLRVLSTLGPEGRTTIAVRDSLQASLVGSHWAAVQKFLQTGDDSALLKFTKKKGVDARRKRFVLLTDAKELERLGSAGVLSFESLYSGGAR